MEKRKQRVVESKIDMGVLAGLVMIFGYFFLCCPVQELNDSFQYLNQFVSREPVYALLLQLLQVCFGTGYASVLGLLQNTLAVVCIYWLYKRLGRLLPFPAALQPLTAIILVSPYVITPFVSKSRMIITNSVLTEGVALSLYYLWFGILLSLLLHYYYSGHKSYMVVSLFLSLLLSMIRGQLIICILVWAIAAGFMNIRDKQYSGLLLVALGLILSLGGKTQLTKVYNYYESGFYVNTVSSKPMLLANALYVAGPQDGKDIQDEALRRAYEEMITGIDEAGLLRKYASGGLMELAHFHEAGHETINFDYIVPILNQYIKEKDGIDESTYFALLIKHEEYSGEILKAVLPNIIPAYMKNYFVIATLGFVRSVAVDKGFLPYYAALLYLVAVILMGMAFYRNRKSSAGFFMLLSLILICGTVFGTSIMIECISRYMIYNLPFFYIAGIALLLELYHGRKRKDK